MNELTESQLDWGPVNTWGSANRWTVPLFIGNDVLSKVGSGTRYWKMIAARSDVLLVSQLTISFYWSDPFRRKKIPTCCESRACWCTSRKKDLNSCGLKLCFAVFAICFLHEHRGIMRQNAVALRANWNCTQTGNRWGFESIWSPSKTIVHGRQSKGSPLSRKPFEPPPQPSWKSWNAERVNITDRAMLGVSCTSRFPIVFRISCILDWGGSNTECLVLMMLRTLNRRMLPLLRPLSSDSILTVELKRLPAEFASPRLHTSVERHDWIAKGRPETRLHLELWFKPNTGQVIFTRGNELSFTYLITSSW